MATQTRWLCGGCGREWVYAHNWNVDQGCPLCGHQGIRRETYDAAFPGADLPRGAAALTPAPAAIAPPTPNTTLAASSPEFG